MWVYARFYILTVQKITTPAIVQEIEVPLNNKNHGLIIENNQKGYWNYAFVVRGLN